MHKLLLINTINIFLQIKFLCILWFDKKSFMHNFFKNDFLRYSQKFNRYPIFKIVLPHVTTRRKNCRKGN